MRCWPTISKVSMRIANVGRPQLCRVAMAVGCVCRPTLLRGGWTPTMGREERHAIGLREGFSYLHRAVVLLVHTSANALGKTASAVVHTTIEPVRRR